MKKIEISHEEIKEKGLKKAIKEREVELGIKIQGNPAINYSYRSTDRDTLDVILEIDPALLKKSNTGGNNA